jgi:hypothetical protein
VGDGTIRYYETLVATYARADACTSRWLPELEQVVGELTRLAG